MPALFLEKKEQERLLPCGWPTRERHDRAWAIHRAAVFHMNAVVVPLVEQACAEARKGDFSVLTHRSF